MTYLQEHRERVLLQVLWDLHGCRRAERLFAARPCRVCDDVARVVVGRLMSDALESAVGRHPAGGSSDGP